MSILSIDITFFNPVESFPINASRKRYNPDFSQQNALTAILRICSRRADVLN